MEKFQKTTLQTLLKPQGTPERTIIDDPSWIVGVQTNYCELKVNKS